MTLHEHILIDISHQFALEDHWHWQEEFSAIISRDEKVDVLTSGVENKGYRFFALKLSCQTSAKEDVGGLRLTICGPRIIFLSILP